MGRPVIFDTSSLPNLIEDLLTLTCFIQNAEDKQGVIQAHFTPGQGKLLVVTGENATGKSYFRRLLAQALRQPAVGDPIECMTISQQGKTDTLNMMKTLIYGDEAYDSTGRNSAGTVLTGMTTCQTRQNPHAVVWDEPDIGLSDNYACGMGQELAAFAAAPPEKTFGLVIISHRKCLMAELAKANPHHLHLGEDPPKNLQDWLERAPTPKSLKSLQEANRTMFQRIQELRRSQKPT